MDFRITSDLESWIEVNSESDFPIQNIPFGVFIDPYGQYRVGTRIGKTVIDLYELAFADFIPNVDCGIFENKDLNSLILLGKKSVCAIREKVAEIFSEHNSENANNSVIQKACYHYGSVNMISPCNPGDYTDFYSSKEHAINVGKLFRDPDKALLPNWKHLPVGYHGRSSSIVGTNVNIRRPKGQILSEEGDPILSPSQKVDFELEVGFLTYEANKLGDSIPIDQAEEYIFGLLLLNDWSARDIQKWEYVPLGPFLGKNFATSVSPWVVTLEALQFCKTDAPVQEPTPLRYLQEEDRCQYDIELEVSIKFKGEKDVEYQKLSNSNFKYLYWTMAQQLAHHTINGCNIRAGDLFGSGTISGPTKDSLGSMLEISKSGREQVPFKNGKRRSFIEDFDTIRFTGRGKANGKNIGFGELTNQLLPSK